ncbi:MAG: hypothetical protein CR997_12425 [Acidobacteria bacterium]|nr:MAG: hypothetical protein CR997_12425 [Acidobacteriota bacterium]
MLNELLQIKKGLETAQIQIPTTHPDIKNSAKSPTIKVSLDKDKDIVVSCVASSAAVWTLRDGNHNSFPFVQIKTPLLKINDNTADKLRQIAVDSKEELHNRRNALLQLFECAKIDETFSREWVGSKMIRRLKERLDQIAKIDSSGEIVKATIKRFLSHCGEKRKGLPAFLDSIYQGLKARFRKTPSQEFLEAVVALLLGKYDQKKKKWSGAGAFLFEAAGFNVPVFDDSVKTAVSSALSKFAESHEQSKETCALTGRKCPLNTNKFPQPNVKVLGQTFLFARNKAIPSLTRYGVTATDSMSVGERVAVELAGAFSTIMAPEREYKTWRSIPGEAPKQSDLLIAFVDGNVDASVIEILSDDNQWKLEEEDEGETSSLSIQQFEDDAAQLLELIRAKRSALNPLVRFFVFRRVDPANRKTVYTNAFSVNEFERATDTWLAGEKNLPEWLMLPVWLKKIRKGKRIRPPHISPLKLISFSRNVFIRRGIRSQDAGGISAAESLSFFFQTKSTKKVGKRLLHMILARRGEMLRTVAHLDHLPRSSKRGEDLQKKYNFIKELSLEALQTCTVLGICLADAGRKKEVYMKDTAFLLGRLLASIDVVHAGYCIDVRKGEIPPTLLGNQIFPLAQRSPKKALATLANRWKPYAAWAKRAEYSDKMEEIREKIKKKDEQSDKKISPKEWGFLKAVKQARTFQEQAEPLKDALKEFQSVTDEFKAELLLGYLAGAPPINNNEKKQQEEKSE